MDHHKLFRVLVIGGAVLGTGCLEEEAPVATADAAVVSDASAALDAARPTPTADAAAAPADAALTECGLCPNEICCETDESGASQLREGFMCCWSTSC